MIHSHKICSPSSILLRWTAATSISSSITRRRPVTYRCLSTTSSSSSSSIDGGSHHQEEINSSSSNSKTQDAQQQDLWAGFRGKSREELASVQELIRSTQVCYMLLAVSSSSSCDMYIGIWPLNIQVAKALKQGFDGGPAVCLNKKKGSSSSSVQIQVRRDT